MLLLFLFSAVALPSIWAIKAPIVGILTQESYSLEKYFPNEEFRSYIAASYVKYVESSGARVIPVWIGRDKYYYKDVVMKTNGLLLPGGSTWFNESGGYGDAGQMLYDAAVERNINGDYYPIWGTCLGMELLMQVSIGGEEIRAHCRSKNISLPLEFLEDFKSSKLFSKAPDSVIDILKTQNVTYNQHGYCITIANYTLYNLTSQWRLMSVNTDEFGLEFISSYEHYKYPFFAVQFHPEKNAFEFTPKNSINHSGDAITVAQYFSNFFIEETRKNKHYFDDADESLIYNYRARYIGINGSTYQQVYMFTEEENVPPLYKQIQVLSF